MRFLRWALAGMLGTAVLALPATADHIRAMVAYQVAAGPGPGEITLRVDFNYSGNCCGGAFSWYTGETDDRWGWVPDGIDNGEYSGPASGTYSFFGGTSPSEYTWSHSQPDPDVPLVRIDITWSYPAGPPATYVVTWDDCCPQSNQKAVVVANQPFQPRRILAADTGNASLATAFAQAEIPPCTPPPTPTGALCYELHGVLPVNLSPYAAILVASEAQPAAVAALRLSTTAIDTWLRGGARGIAVYGQTDPASWDWLPTGSGSLGVASALANDVTVTTDGMAHMSHVNQLPTVSTANGGLTVTVNGTLAGWGMSTVNVFTSAPAYLGPALAARSSTGDVVALAGHYDGGPGCQVLTGQPIDDRAAAGRAAAQQMFRSTLAYALTCVDAARLT